jgi:hypothetical protein
MKRLRLFLLVESGAVDEDACLNLANVLLRRRRMAASGRTATVDVQADCVHAEGR